MIAQLQPAHFTAWRDACSAATPPVVLDVREAWEVQTATVNPDGFTLLHIPMRELPGRLAELQAMLHVSQPLACLCHHGIRSQQVAHFLAHGGFTDVVNLQGGIAAWSQQLDATVPLY